MPSGSLNGKWPKYIPPLSQDQQRISDEFMKLWHEILPRYAIIERFNHSWAVKTAPRNFKTTLEIGAGLGEHLEYEQLTSEQESHYVALELRENMAAEVRKRFPRVQTHVGDCQQRLDFPDSHFDRILAIHVLEHIPNLPAAIREMHRLCNKSEGVCQIVIPCEGSPAYTFCRRISAQRFFEKRYKQPYRWFIEREHLNRPDEVLEELAPYFTVEKRAFFPLPVPVIAVNLCLGLFLRPKP